MSSDKTLDWQLHWNEPLEWPGPLPDLAEARRLHRDRRPAPAACALVLIDIDKKAADRHIQQFGAHDAAVGEALAHRTYRVALPNWVRLTAWFREQGRPVIHVKWAAYSHPFPPLAPLDGEAVVTKASRGAFATSRLHDILQELKVTELAVAGSDTAFCVAATVYGAIDRGYRVFLIEDACVSCLQRLHEATVESLGWQQAHILTTADLLTLTSN